VEQYRVYLRAELGKLRSHDGAAQFLAHDPMERLANHHLSDSAEALTAKFASQELVDQYVAALQDPLLIQLTDYCGQWRGNGIENMLFRDQTHEFLTVPISTILLSPAEPVLFSVFEENAWRLTVIANDQRVLSSVPYCDHERGEPVSFGRCLARCEGTQYQIFDGMHRAIQLVRNGEECIPLCVVHDANRPPEDERKYVGRSP
jgi:hypothetical protein